MSTHRHHVNPMHDFPPENIEIIDRIELMADGSRPGEVMMFCRLMDSDFAAARVLTPDDALRLAASLTALVEDSAPRADGRD